MNDIRIELRALIYQEDQAWVAHCLEMDLVATGDSPQDALDNMIELAEFQIQTALEEADFRSILRPAPPEIFELYMKSRSVPELHPPRSSQSVERIDIRQFALAS